MRPSTSIDASSRFRVMGPLGSGSYGSVYEALDARTGQRVAIKELSQLDADSISRFKQEFRALADLHHPNLVSLKELIEEDQRWVIVMELVPGEDFLTYVRPRRADNDNAGGPEWDAQRLRSALVGMAQGLAALHGHGVVHRDLKPKNVLITPDARAVLLDFGLVTSIDPREQSTDMVVGTVGYMAPEQAKQRNVGPPADWYALGVCLFEALTGRQPFEAESPLQVLMDKQAQPAPRASSLVKGVPPDLDELCAALLERAPERRPGAREVLQALGQTSPDAALPFDVPRTPSQPTFAGRQSEFQLLESALKRTHAGELKVVLVEGESGVGKTELVSEFLRRTRAHTPELTSLYGRCYENEQVSYKAFDGCIDDLSRVLRGMSDTECGALLPPRAAVLGQLFPVLRTVPSIDVAPRTNISADPSARRLEAFGALAALLSRLAEERSLVVFIDDLQWADAESFRLLQALLERPVPPPILIVATIRPRDELEPETAAQVDVVRGWKQTDVIRLLGLPHAQAEELARRLLGHSVPPDWLKTIADESEGHPLFLSELVQYTRSYELSARGSVTLEAALCSRIEKLDPQARALLELSALAARPYGEQVFARALGVESVEEPARTLLVAKMLRLRKGTELGVYHDRIRKIAASLVPSERVPTLHRQLAAALALDPLADVSEQAHHWDLAGEVDRAIDAYSTAAQRALEALAFMRAERLCARALELLRDPDDPRRTELTVRRADALACGGHSGEASVLYTRAADRTTGERRIVLRSRGAHQLMLSGDLKRGFDAARELLRDIGIRLPVGTLGTLAHLVYARLWFALRARTYSPKRPESGNESLQAIYQVVEQLAAAMSILHPASYLILNVWLLRKAAKHGILRGYTQAHASMGWVRAMSGSFSAAIPLFEQGRKICEEVGDPVMLARNLYVEGSARLAGGDLAGTVAALERAHALAQVHALDDPALLTNIRYHLGAAWYATGRYARFTQEMEGWLVEARERQDRRAVALLLGMGYGQVRWLMQDAPDRAENELAQAMASLPGESFSFLQFGEMFAAELTHLYRGGRGALEWLEQYTKKHGEAVLLKLTVGKLTLGIFWCLACLAASVEAPPAERTRLLRKVRKLARKLARADSQMVRAYALLARAQVAAVEREPARALKYATAAVAICEANGLGIRNSSMYLHAILRDGHAQGERAKQALANLRDQGFREPLRGLQITLPTLPLLMPRVAPHATGRQLLLDRFEIVGQLGSGGFGAVMEARDVHTDRRVAVKMLTSKSGRSIERFKQEFRALQDIHHAHLVRLDALLQHGGTWYIAMELVEGVELTAYVRTAAGASVERVRRAFGGIAKGLAALHAAGFVHRDVTPRNVRVTPDGHAVLLDFGLIARIDDPRDTSGLGSVEYAAPEQLEGAAPSPSADVYGLGSCLYQALTGRPPFAALPLAQLLREKRETLPELPAAAGPEELVRLCLRMLAPDPERRPPLREVLDALASDTVDQPARPSLRGSGSDAAHFFTGREKEFAELSDAFERTPDDGLVLALVEGESGIGKSALVDAFGSHLEASFPRLLALRGRCYESEQVGFKAFDGAVDQLAQALRALPSPECEALLPRKAALLGQLFPVLTTVPVIAQAPERGLPAEPVARQRAAIEAFVQLLEQLTSRYELLFLIDDLQWADSESFKLLRLLLERRATLPMMLVCTLRPTEELPQRTRDELASLRAHPAVQGLVLAGLSRGALAELTQLLGAGELPTDRVEFLLRESNGHPLFLRELVDQERLGIAVEGRRSLDQALRASITLLDEQARMLLSLVALAEKPYGMHVLARAMSCHELPREALSTLLGRGLLRRSGEDELACYHDRIRRVAVELLRPETRRKLARKLASSLDPAKASHAAERARLWDAAGDVDRAVYAYEQAAEHARGALAFAREEAHYARALALLGEHEDERWERLIVRHGRALASVGRSAEAARAFQLAARRAEGEERVKLRLLEAQHLMQGAEVEEGLRASRALLSELGVPVPESPTRAVARLMWDRSVLAARGLSVRHGAAPPTPDQRMRLDAAWALALPLAWVDPLASAAVSSQHLRMALAAGEPSHVARALAEEAFIRVVQNPEDEQADRLLQRAHELAVERDDAALEAVLAFREGVICNYRWQLSRGNQLLERALSLVTERCPEEVWLQTNVRTALGTGWNNTGEHARLASAHAVWTAEARDRRDQFALTNLTGLGWGTLPYLMDDRPEDALAEVERHHAQWPREPFSYARFGEMLGLSSALFYQGGDGALRWFDREMPRLSRAFLLRTALGKSTLLYFLSIAVMKAYVSASGAEAAALLARARRVFAQLARERSPFAAQVQPGVAVALQIIDGDHERAHASTVLVREKAEEVGHFLTIAPMLYLEGLLEGRGSGRDKRERALSMYAQQGWKEPGRAVKTYCPVAELLERALV